MTQLTSCLILPVPAALAVEWAYGHHTDSELLHLADSLSPGQDVGLFILSLFGKSAWRDLRRQFAAFPAARCVITRTSHPVVVRWLLKYGCEAKATDLPGERRYLGDRATVEKFLKHLTLSPAPAMVDANATDPDPHTETDVDGRRRQ